MKLEIRGMARNTDPVTSHLAARDVAPRRMNYRDRLLLEYASAISGYTDDEAAAAAGLLDSCYWKRCSELRENGFIEPVMVADAILTRIGRAGSARMICRITAEGRERLREVTQSP